MSCESIDLCRLSCPVTENAARILKQSGWRKSSKIPEELREKHNEVILKVLQTLKRNETHNV